MPETPKEPRKPRRGSPEAIEKAKVRSAVTKVIMAAETAVKKARGAPSKYDPIIAQGICEQLSLGIPLREICRQPGHPSARAVYAWIVADSDLAAHIARAREIGYDQLAEECLDIADNATNDWTTRETVNKAGQPGVERALDSEHIQRSKLRIETRLKLLAKWRPDKYGDKTIITGDANGAPIKTEETGSGRLFDLIRAMEMGKRVAG